MVRHNDVVLGLCGKHVWWPARVHLHGGAAPSSDGISVIFFGDHKSAWLPHRKLRSFGELDALTHRERGRTPLYAKAIDEAREWASSHTSASTSEDDDDGADNWACNGEIVPARLLPIKLLDAPVHVPGRERTDRQPRRELGRVIAAD